MDPFVRLTGVAAPLAMINVDTDMIIPKQFLKTIRRSGLGRALFHDLRYHDDGTEHPDFVLNRHRFRNAVILIAGDNFGCGSSREHAPWALLDFGIRCIIAPSYADIFYNNCFKNGILPVVLDRAAVEGLAEEVAAASDPTMTVDLEAETIHAPAGQVISLPVDPFRKHCLINGLDDIGLTLEKAAHIDAYEARLRQHRPWLHS